MNDLEVMRKLNDRGYSLRPYGMQWLVSKGSQGFIFPSIEQIQLREIESNWIDNSPSSSSCSACFPDEIE